MIISAASAAGDSGDAAVSCGLPDGSLAFILSDGMGRGMKAAAESGTAIRRLRKMLRDGVDANRAIRELNRYMVNKSGEDENFATIDMTVIDKSTGKIAGFLNGLSTNEHFFRDEFFTDAELHEPEGANVMLLGLDVLPEYRGQGLAKEIMHRYLRRESEKGRKVVILTCLKSKVGMYEKLGFQNRGKARSSWGGEQWYEMSCTLND